MVRRSALSRKRVPDPAIAQFPNPAVTGPREALARGVRSPRSCQPPTRFNWMRLRYSTLEAAAIIIKNADLLDIATVPTSCRRRTAPQVTGGVSTPVF
jgi:hypothetical protein